MRKETWETFEQLQKEGKIKNIGVSNYTIPHLKELLSFFFYFILFLILFFIF
jgi:methylglyoxal/glyoxal reductase